MDWTPNLTLPYILSGQSQKHLSYNEAVDVLDTLCQLACISKVATTPPSDPVNGHAYIIPSNSADLWENKTNQIAIWQENTWVYMTPQIGWRAWVIDEEKLYVFHNDAWQVFSSGDRTSQSDGADIWGINTSEDNTNRLAVSSAASLFTHEGNDHRLFINKNSETDTSSIIFETNYAAHAELGLLQNNNLSLSVTNDQVNWNNAFEINSLTGEVIFPNTTFASVGGGASSSTVARSTDNLLLNPTISINQRIFSGGALSENTYGYDRWKAASPDTDITHSSGITTLANGAIEQPVDLQDISISAGLQISFIIEGLQGADLLIEFAGLSHTAISDAPDTHHVTWTTPNDITGINSLKLTTTSNACSFSRVGLFIGAYTSIDFEIPFADRLEKCLSYYQKSYDYDALPGAVDTETIGIGYAYSATLAGTNSIPFIKDLYKIPTITFHSSTLGGATSTINKIDVFQMGQGWKLSTSITAFRLSTKYMWVRIQLDSGYTSNNPILYAGGWTADAEIY